MRTSFLLRSAVAVASLAIGSVALVAAPSSAATSSGITREQVLQVASNYRFGDFFDPSPDPTMQALVDKVCRLDSTTGRDIEIEPAVFESAVDGFLIKTLIEGSDTRPPRNCTFAAFATTEPFSTMSGTAKITLADQPANTNLRAAAAIPSHDYALSGDVYVTAPVDDIAYGDNTVATASGEVVKTQTSVTTSSRVVTPKSTRHKAAARKAYQRTIDRAQTRLVKALKKAGKSNSKKKTARKTYAARKKAAKATLHIAWAGDVRTVVTTDTTSATKVPFTFTTVYPPL